LFEFSLRSLIILKSIHLDSFSGISTISGCHNSIIEELQTFGSVIFSWSFIFLVYLYCNLYISWYVSFLVNQVINCWSLLSGESSRGATIPTTTQRTKKSREH
jgi:hypothetical protein